MLAGISFGQQYWVKNGETAPSISVFMMKISDGSTAPEVTEDAIDVTYREVGAAAVTYTDTADCALTDAYTSKGIKYIGGGWYRFDPPVVSVDTGVGKSVTFSLTDGTYEGHILVHLSPQTDTVTVNGNAPYDTANIDGIKTKTDFLPSVTAGDAGGLAIVGSEMGTASVWDALWTSYTTENSFGYIIKRMYDKVMGLRK